MKKEILSLAMLLPMLVLADHPKNITSKLAVQPKAATDQLIINPEARTDASKGIAIYVGDNSQVQIINLAISSNGQLADPDYTPTTIGSLRVNNSIFLTFEDLGGSVTQFDSIVIKAPFTNPSQSASVEGSGTSADPFQVTTKLEAIDTALGIDADITIIDSYVVPNQYFDRQIELANLPQDYQTKVFWVLDTALNSSGGTTEGYCYTTGDTIGVYDTGVTISLDAGTPKWAHYTSENSAPAQILIFNDLDDSDCSGRNDAFLSGQWDVDSGESSYTMKTRVSFATQTVMATYNPDAVEVDEDSTLTLLVNNDTRTAMSAASFDYTLPSSITLASPTPSGNTCPVTSSISATGDTITASNIDLAVGESCTITYQVKGVLEGSPQSGILNSVLLDPLVGTIQVNPVSAASGSAVTIPSSNWLGLLLLALASIGFGRYYFKK